MTALRILVVEDDPSTGELLGELLSGMGHHVCAIESTEAGAVAAAAAHRPDLMIVDVRLRGGCGVDAVAQILRAGFIAHVFASGDALSERELGAVVIRKPYRQADLVRAIARALGAGGR
jgi:CheY-like chemotaxis protein